MSLLIKDGNGINREIATNEAGGVHTPVNAVTGPLTDAELRASAVPVSGPLTDAQLRATAVPVSGPLTDGQLRATAVPVSGPVTDAQLRATAVPVSGPATDAQIRATPLRVVNGGNPLTSGIYTLGALATAAVTIPGTATAVRLIAATNDFRFGIDVTPVAHGADALTVGGTAKVGVLREARIPSGATTLNLLSVLGGTVDVEFVS